MSATVTQRQRTLQNSTMISECFTAARPGRLVKAEDKINVEKYKEFLEDNLFQSENKLQLGVIFIFHAENIMKHLRKTTQKCF